MSQTRDLSQTDDWLRLTVKTFDAQSEILVLDARGRFIDRAFGPEHTFELERGIYRVKVITGSESEEKPVVLTEQSSKMQFARIAFASPVPLVGTSTSHEYHVEAASTESVRTHVEAGSGSSLFFLVRDWTPTQKPERRQRIVANPATGLSLHAITAGGAMKIADLAQEGTNNLDMDAWAACTVDVNPGVYELQLVLPAGGTLHQSIVASPNWQTQAFVFMRGYSTSDGQQESVLEWRADLSRTSLLLARGKGFRPDERILRLTELSRVALSSKHSVESGDSPRRLLPDQLRELLRLKFEDPMLGIYGGHLLLLESPFDASLFREVVRNLRLLLTSHPDVEALALRAAGEPTPAPFEQPPMLRRSWTLMIDASADRPDVITESLAGRITSEPWPEGPWYIWETRDVDLAEVPGAIGLSDVEQAIAETLGVLKQVRRVRRERVDAGAGPEGPRPRAPLQSRSPELGSWALLLFMKVWRYLNRLAGSSIELESMGGRSIEEPVTPQLMVELDDKKLRAICRQFGLPQSQLRSVLTTLEGKLNQIPYAPVVNVVVGSRTIRTEVRSSPAGSRWCVSWFADRQAGFGATRAQLQKNARWTPGDVIRIGFLDGDVALQQRVREHALAWAAPEMANLHFVFTIAPDADIRVAFQPGDGSWSSIGTTCRKVPRGQPTMNFGWINADSPDEDVRSVVLHEFGHALGLLHEHQAPAGAVKLNKEALFRELAGPPLNWSREEVEFNVVRPLEVEESNFTGVDPKSIMLCPIPKTWTLDAWSIGFNVELSKRDQQLIRQLYG